MPRPGQAFIANETFFLKISYVNGRSESFHAPKEFDENNQDIGWDMVVFDPNVHKRIIRLFYSMSYYSGELIGLDSGSE